ncbi:hypothetical protein [Streptomyces sp. F001]|uniref:hypothetical protein n=1 Tax=Streptomyces sp. F001 TaxID=1510026 RepID=UPI00101E841B|nr:hypothetical protein [Streptomyces sp. F001]
MASLATAPAVRLMRSAVFAAVCVTTTAAGHALTTGHTLAVRVVTGAFAAVLALAWWLSDRARGSAVVVGATVVTQFALHAAFTASRLPAGHRHAHGTPHPPAHAAYSDEAMDRRHHAMEAASLLGDRTATAATHGASTAALLAHVAAGLLCGLWMWRGDATMVRLGRLLLLVLCAPLELAGRLTAAAVPKRRPAAAPPAHDEVPALGRMLLHHVVSRRGPPVGLRLL